MFLAASVADFMPHCAAEVSSLLCDGHKSVGDEGVNLESLLQSLFMTLEFRAALYEWQHAGPPSADATTAFGRIFPCRGAWPSRCTSPESTVTCRRQSRCARAVSRGRASGATGSEGAVEAKLEH